MNNNVKLITEVLMTDFNDAELVEYIMKNSDLIKYLEKKIKPINKIGNTVTKPRLSITNIYVLYILIEDYISKKDIDDINYEGMLYRDISTRINALPLGNKLQNKFNSLGYRCNEEYGKYFPSTQLLPIKRNLITKRYWIEESLLKLNYSGDIVNIGKSVLGIIENYIKVIYSEFIKGEV